MPDDMFAKIDRLKVAYRSDDGALDPRPPEFTDDALALRFAEKHVGDLCYVAAWGQWYEWTGTHWKPDETVYAFEKARHVCREASAECNNPKDAKALASAKTVTAVERMAKGDRRLAATIDQWDSDLWLLNTPGGTVDLRTGQKHGHRRESYITKMTAAAPAGDCRRWREFLARITGGDEELQRYLQRMAGYCLTGSIDEHALFFGYGTGANGKSVFVNTIAGIMGDYATTAPMETFIASNSDRHPTDLAGLRGARLVTAHETEQGRRWAESKIKALTGGDKISARFMRQDFFEYVPQFKLVIVGNHKPALRGVDEAIRRRMNLIPFTVTIPEGDRDEKLPERLREEWPGILQWMIDGCVEWQREGLAKPEAVKKATDEYLASEDVMAEWIAECCMTGNYTDSSSNLYDCYKHWADRAGETAMSQKAFSQALSARGFTKLPHTRTGTKFEGIAVRPAINHFGYES